MPAFFSPRMIGALAGAAMLSGCVSLGAEPPASLLNLTATDKAPVGTQRSGVRGKALAVMIPSVPAKIDVIRVPVQVSETEIAYIKDAVWVEKPARLFQRLMAETLRARSQRLIVEADVSAGGSPRLQGTLREFGYDAMSGSVVVRFDAERMNAQGNVETRRFEASEAGVIPKAGNVGAALNRTANDVAGQVADWVLAV
ncbi:MAG: ABC-type transport auxiliary lipoprotein family protein [Marinomonas sp.]